MRKGSLLRSFSHRFFRRLMPAAALLTLSFASAACAGSKEVGGVELAEGRGHKDLAPEHIAHHSVGAVGIVTTDMGRGMGFVVDPAGYLITNRHVLEDAEFIREVSFPGLVDNPVFTAVKIVYIDPHRDLALIKIESERMLPYLELATDHAIPVSDYVEDTDRVLLLSREEVDNGEGEEQVGLVAHMGRVQRLEVYNPTVGPGPFLGLTNDVQQGQSGGPVVDRFGRAVGVVTWTWRDRKGGFAIPIGEATRMLEERPQLENEDRSLARAELRVKNFVEAVGQGELDEARRMTSPSHAREVRGRTVPVLLDKAAYDTEILAEYVQTLDNVLSSEAGEDPFTALQGIAAHTSSDDFRRALGVEGAFSRQAVVTFFYELGQAYLAARYFGGQSQEEAMEATVRRLHSLDAARSFVMADLLDDLDGLKFTIEHVTVSPGLYGPKAVAFARGQGPNRGLKLAFQMRMEWGDWYIGDVQVVG